MRAVGPGVVGIGVNFDQEAVGAGGQGGQGHGRDVVAPAGAHGLLIEVHPDPDHALSDGAQSLSLDRFERLLGQLEDLARPLGRIVRG